MLHQNHPNPFNPSTSIGFELAAGGRIVLDVFDACGAHVIRLADEFLGPGGHVREWRGLDRHGRPVPSGVYLYRLAAPGRTVSRKMVLVR